MMNRFTARKEGKDNTTMERMAIMSMVPLSIDPANSSPENVSALDRHYEVYQNPMSGFAQTLEFHPNDKIDDREMHIPTKQRKVTPYRPACVRQKQYYPDPGSYTPDYAAMDPEPRLTTIQGRNTAQRPMEHATTSEIVARYSRDVRSFDGRQIQNVNDALAGTVAREGPDLSRVSGFDQQLTRKVDFALHRPSENVGFYVPPAEKVTVPSFDGQSSRADPPRPVGGRDYSYNAHQQLMKLRGAPKVSRFEMQSGRKYEPKKNERVAFLEEITAQQTKMFQKLKPQRAASVMGEVKRSQQFDIQTSRQAKIPYHTKETFNDSKFPTDVEKSLKAVWPRTRYTTIKPITEYERTHEGRCFWMAGK